MKVGKTTDENIAAKGGETVEVPSVKLDDLIQDFLTSYQERVFVAKIDTQGYEPHVFAGLSESVFTKKRVEYILFEYWPKGMDLLASTGEAGSDHTKACLAADLLERLQKAGYTLYALPNTSHPRAPWKAKQALKNELPPMNNVRDNCEWYYQLEERFPSDYKMGYWSDILAVSPYATMVANPQTSTGRALKASGNLAAPS